ncbi:MAG: hypothetical protein WDM77_00155 [Steroidobacteraceae bacterium]
MSTPDGFGLEKEMTTLCHEGEPFDVPRRQAHKGLLRIELQINLIPDPPLQHVDLSGIVVGNADPGVRARSRRNGLGNTNGRSDAQGERQLPNSRNST